MHMYSMMIKPVKCCTNKIIRDILFIIFKKEGIITENININVAFFLIQGYFGVNMQN